MENLQNFIDKFVAEPMHWHWWILGVLLLGLEILAPGVVFLWIALSAIITGVVAFIVPSASWSLLGSIFAVLSVICALIGRHYLKPKYNNEDTDHPNLSRRGEAYIGKSYKLIKPIENGYGKVQIGDSQWRVSGDDMPEGKMVKVTDIDGTTLVVKTNDE